MNMKDEKRAPAPPLRYGYLLTADGFIRHCKERGVRTDRKQLEYYDRQNLLVPVVGIYHPVGVYKGKKREDGTLVYTEHGGDPNEKRYYHSEGISIGAPQYTYRYFGLVAQARKPDGRLSKNPNSYCDDFCPASQAFIPWEELAFKSHDFVENKSDLGKPVLFCYSPEQIFPLVEIQHRLSITIKDSGLFRSEESWVKTGKEFERVFTPELASLKSIVQNQYNALSLCHDAEDLWFDLIKEEMEKLERDPYRSDLTKVDLDARVRAWKKKDKSGAAQKILVKHGVSKDQLRTMAELFIYPAFFKDPNIEIWEVYRQKLPLEWLDKQKGVAKLCDDYYRIAERLLWIFSEVSRKQLGLEDYYRTRSTRFMESCVVCGGGYKPAKKNGKPQVTCGSESCVTANRNMNKRKKRPR